MEPQCSAESLCGRNAMICAETINLDVGSVPRAAASGLAWTSASTARQQAGWLGRRGSTARGSKRVGFDTSLAAHTKAPTGPIINSGCGFTDCCKHERLNQTCVSSFLVPAVSPAKFLIKNSLTPPPCKRSTFRASQPKQVHSIKLD